MHTKINLVFIFLIFLSFQFKAQKLDSIIDSRDGKLYGTVQIGTQVWMAQNLNFQSESSWCYENKIENCEKYGRLYSLEAANTSCPVGWHLPSDAEWMILEKFLGMLENDLSKNNAWRGSDQGKKLLSDKSLSFNIILGGYRNPPSNYNLLNLQAFFWTSTDESGSAWFRQFYENSSQIFRKTRPVSWAFSVRCVKD
jgi:uncharacterized protein (TIGR02145 family)